MFALLTLTPNPTVSPKAVLRNAEKEKKTKYVVVCEDRRAVFTPLCCSVDGILGSEAEVFIKRLGEGLANKWD